VRTPNVDQVLTVEPIGTVSFACPPPTAGISDLLPVSTAVVDVPQWGAARLRPSVRQRAALGRITATGVGYGFSSALATGVPGARRSTAAATAAEQAGNRTNGDSARTAGTTAHKQQLHLMSRRDPRTWRPPV
jgi:hypothetical protein